MPWCHFKRCNVWNPWIFVTTAGCTPYLTSVDNSPQPTIFRFFPLQQTEWGRETKSNPDSSILSRKSGKEPTWKLTWAGKDSHRAKHRHWYVDKWNVNIVDRVQRVKSSEELKGERSPIKVCLYFWKLWTNVYLCLMEQLLWCTWENWRLLLLLNTWCILRDLLCQLFVIMSSRLLRDNCKGALNTSPWQLQRPRLILPISSIITVNGGKTRDFFAALQLPGN